MPVSTANSKVESVEKSLKKGKDTRIQVEKSDGDEEFNIYTCFVCCEHFNCSRPGDDWVQCLICKHWAHELCTTGENIFSC